MEVTKMKKFIILSTLLVSSAVLFTGCTKTEGDSASSVNPSVTVEAPSSTTVESTKTEEVTVLQQGNTLDDLDKDLKNTDFSGVGLEIDSEL